MTKRKTDPLAGSDGAVTLGEWLGFAEELYASRELALGQVATNAHDEALYLLLRTLDLPLDSDASVLEKALTEKEQAAVREMLRRRAIDRVPAAYLTHEAWLGEHWFYVDKRVIIPRSYFLELIPQLDHEPGAGDPALQLPIPRGKVRRVADLCTGAGCLAILLAHHFPRATVDACDLSPDALDVAKINVREHRLTERVRLHASDVFDAVPPVHYDVIVSNPPYEPSAHVDTQAPEFAAEPRMAHDGGADGLEIVRKIVRQSAKRLAPHGLLLIEVGGLRRAINREFRALAPRWLPTEDGSDCVVLFTAEKLRAAELGE